MVDLNSFPLFLKELSGNEIGSSDLFEPHRLRGAGNGANAAAHTFFRIHEGQIVIHSNGVEKASVQTGFTTRTQIGIHYGLETAGGDPFFRTRHDGPVHTAILAAITDDMAHDLAIVRDMNEPFFLAHSQYLNGLALGKSSSRAPLQVVFSRTIHLHADLQRFPTRTIDNAT
jgi:hypothetical protein